MVKTVKKGLGLLAATLFAASAAHSGEVVVPQEYTAEQFWEQIKRSCLHENPMMFEDRAKRLEESYGWASVDAGDAKGRYVSPGGGITLEVDRSMIEASCIISVKQGAVDDDFDAIAAIQGQIEDLTGQSPEITTDGEYFVWNWKGEGSYQFQVYDVRVRDNAGLTIEWTTE